MAYRTFIDSHGVEWQTWDVLPKGVERRITDRRVCPEALSFPDRRHVDRRQVEGHWSPLTSGLRDGWLCFDGGGNRRRLTPIPPDWEECAPAALERYCGLAVAGRGPAAGARYGRLGCGPSSVTGALIPVARPLGGSHSVQ